MPKLYKKLEFRRVRYNSGVKTEIIDGVFWLHHAFESVKNKALGGRIHYNIKDEPFLLYEYSLFNDSIEKIYAFRTEEDFYEALIYLSKEVEHNPQAVRTTEPTMSSAFDPSELRGYSSSQSAPIKRPRDDAWNFNFDQLDRSRGKFEWGD